MALIFPDSTCAICNEPLDRPYTATSGCAFAPPSPLYAYCDAPLHFDCLERWPEREAFSWGYFERDLEHFRNHANLLVEREGWILGAGPTRRNHPPAGILRRLELENELPFYAEVRLPDWPFRLYAHWPDWEAFIAADFREGLAGEALEVSERVMTEVRHLVPDSQALLDLLEESYQRAASTDNAP